MLTSQYANLVSFFYPLGNTAAVSLTQDLPPEKKANILLLGAGDLRHILFTVHTDHRPLDVTACDVEKAVIARNVLLLSLFIDDIDGCSNGDSLGTRKGLYWNVYYHFRIDEASLELLQSQAQKLHSLSSSLQNWHASTYGKLIRAYDYGTLTRMRDMWSFYAMRRKGQELSRFEQHHQAYIGKSKQFRSHLGVHINLSGSRSAFPAWLPSIKDLGPLHTHYWKHGTTDLDHSILARPMHANPMFMSPDDNVVLHYGTDPLLGFHLAMAYVPLAPKSPLLRSSVGLASMDNVVEAAKTEFYAWISSFKKRSQSIILRVYIGDALAFSHSLQHETAVGLPKPAHWYRDRFHFDPLRLEKHDLANGKSAPLAFTVIDTSNLIDHVGSLNLLAATAPLLAHDMCATLYGEKLVKLDSTYSALFNDLLYGSLPTVSMLLGLTSVDLVTNTSAISSGDELILDTSIQRPDMQSFSVGQLFTRIAWKRSLCLQDGFSSKGALKQIEMSPTSLATLLYSIYVRMFENEDVTRLMSSFTLHKMQKFSTPTHQRASYAAFISIVKVRIRTDWPQTMRSLLDRIEANVSHLLTMNYIQELYLWLHLFDLYSVDTFKPNAFHYVNHSKTRDLRDWKDIPPVVCVTLEVPREKLKVFTGGDSTSAPTPPVQCLVQGHSNGRPWQNIFAAIQCGFGRVECRGVPFTSSFEVDVVEDKSCWSGKSPLLASFHVPAWMLLQQPRTASVRFGLQSTPHNIRTFLATLGVELNVYQTTLSDTDHVFISKTMPNQVAAVSMVSSTIHDTMVPTSNGPFWATSMTVAIDSTTADVTSMTGRVDILTEECKAALLAGGSVVPNVETPFNVSVSLPPGLKPTVNFPVSISESGLKTRIARKSAYIEIVCRASSRADWSASRTFMYPVVLDSGTVTAWNMPYLNLQTFPILDVRHSSRLAWLTTHTSMMWSTREKSLREQPMLQATPSERTRVEFKDSLFSLFMHFSGVQGRRARIFGISCPTDGGIHILVFVSSLRLDLSNRTVVLDAAVMPLYDELMPRIRSFLGALATSGTLCQITTTAAEMQVWKQVLPAFVERCRTWSHGARCEYLTQRQVPLSVEAGQRLLCSCGAGILPVNFIADVPQWKNVAPHVTRAAISPCFPAAMFQTGIGENASPQAQDSKEDVCRVCQKSRGADGVGLLNCTGCRRVKYCSRDCQRADWKTHKLVCKAT